MYSALFCDELAGVELISCRFEADDALSTILPHFCNSINCCISFSTNFRDFVCCSFVLFSFELILFTCKRMLPFEALSFGLRGSNNASKDEAGADFAGEGEKECVGEAVFDFGISIGTGAVVVCRSARCTSRTNSNYCFAIDICFAELAHFKAAASI